MNKQTILSYSNFNALTKDVLELAKEIMPDKVIYINFLNRDVQVTLRVSKHETKVHVEEGYTIPVEYSICNTLDYQNGTPLVTEDITQLNFDEKVKKTIEDSNIKAYLGIPISFKSGERFGTLCAAHDEVRPFESKDVNLLQSIANLFSYYLELEHIAYKDALTGLFNAHFLVNRHQEMLESGGFILMLDLDYFKEVNDRFGHHVGDMVLQEVGNKLNSITDQFKDAYAVRLGGDEFLLYVKDELTPQEMTTLIHDLIAKLKVWESPIADLGLSTSIGAFPYLKGDFEEITGVLKKADTLLYRAKHKGRNNFILEIK